MIVFTHKVNIHTWAKRRLCYYHRSETLVLDMAVLLPIIHVHSRFPLIYTAKFIPPKKISAEVKGTHLNTLYCHTYKYPERTQGSLTSIAEVLKESLKKC